LLSCVCGNDCVTSVLVARISVAFRTCEGEHCALASTRTVRFNRAMQANLNSVRARRAFISRQLSALQSEDAELENVEKVLERLSGASTIAVRVPGKRGRPLNVTRRGTGRPDIASATKAATAASGKSRAAAKTNGAAGKATTAAKATNLKATNGKASKSARGRSASATRAKGGARGKRGAGGSQRELVLAALKKPGASWMDVRTIISNVKDSHGVSMPPRSISPLLSNLKRAGSIVRKGRLVALPDRARATNR